MSRILKMQVKSEKKSTILEALQPANLVALWLHLQIYGRIKY